MTAPNATMSAGEVLEVLMRRAAECRSNAIVAEKRTERPSVAKGWYESEEETLAARAAVAAMAEREAALVARLKALESEVSARRSGWASFVDDEDPSLLVVAHHDRSVHFTGASAWDDANAFDATRTEPRHA